LKRNNQVRIIKLFPKDIVLAKEIVEIFSESLGFNYITRKEITNILNNKTDKILLAAFMNHNMVGVRIIKILNQKEINDFNQVIKPQKLPHHKIGMLVSSAVRKCFRQQGIGTSMIYEGIKELKKMGCSVYVATAWDSGQQKSSTALLEKFNFKKIKVLKNYWKEKSIVQNFECPVCGKPPCTCTAVFYMLDK